MKQGIVLPALVWNERGYSLPALTWSERGYWTTCISMK